MRLFILLALVLGGFSLPAHASKQLDRCADHKFMQSNRGVAGGYLYIRRLDTGEAVSSAPGNNMALMEKKFEEYCSDR